MKIRLYRNHHITHSHTHTFLKHLFHDRDFNFKKGGRLAFKIPVNFEIVYFLFMLLPSCCCCAFQLIMSCHFVAFPRSDGWSSKCGCWCSISSGFDAPYQGNHWTPICCHCLFLLSLLLTAEEHLNVGKLCSLLHVYSWRKPLYGLLLPEAAPPF